MQEQFQEVKKEADTNLTKFLDFKDSEFPTYMVDFKQDMIETLIQ